MSWPCPDCGEPFIPNHMCPTLRKYLSQGRVSADSGGWRWLARTLMLEAHAAQQAFLIEEGLRMTEIRAVRKNRIQELPSGG